VGYTNNVIITKINTYALNTMSGDSVVGIATGYGLDDRGVGVRVPVGSRIFTSRSRPNWLWGSTYYSMGTGDKAAGGVKLTTHLQLVPRSRKRASIHPLPHKPSWHSA
jgi:hypothetical protein